MKRAVALFVDGHFEEIDGDYESIKAVIGGWLEIAPTPGAPFVMFCNEEGKLNGLPLNKRADEIANVYRNWQDPIVGNVVFVGPADAEGENTSFVLEDLRAALTERATLVEFAGAFGIGGQAAQDQGARGPYGTNEGDKWLAEGSPVQARLDADGKGLVLIHEMLVRDGELQEVMYVTDNADLIAEATLGHEAYIAQKASEN